MKFRLEADVVFGAESKMDAYGKLRDYFEALMDGDKTHLGRREGDIELVTIDEMDDDEFEDDDDWNGIENIDDLDVDDNSY